MTHDPKFELSDLELDGLLGEARLDTPLPSANFLARLEADALRMLPEPPPVVVRPTFWDRVSTILGRVALPSGLVAAGLTGLWIGIAAGTGDYAVYTNELSLQMVDDFPVLAGILAE